MNKKKVLLAWSGGLDSTYLIQYYLQAGYSVDVVNCSFQNSSQTQMKREDKAIKKMLKGYFKDKDVKLLGKSTITFTGYSFSKLFLGQVPTWVYNLINYLNSEHTEVAVGYVMNDDAISFLDDIRKLWNSYAGLVKETLPPLVFPLIKYTKTFIYGDLHPELKKHITWCESFGPADLCGTCHSCRRMIDLGIQTPPMIQIEEPMKPQSIKKTRKK